MFWFKCASLWRYLSYIHPRTWLDLYVVVSRQTRNNGINAGDIPTILLPPRVIVERGRILTSQQCLWREDCCINVPLRRLLWSQKRKGVTKKSYFDSFASRFFINKNFGIRRKEDHLVGNFKSFYNKSGPSFLDFKLFY